MKQTDKCECGHIRNVHYDRSPYKCFHKNCKCIKFKLHSQEARETCLKTVRASEEDVGRVGSRTESHKGESHNMLPSSKTDSSSVPYTPLTRKAIEYEPNGHKVISYDKFLSALNGLRQDLYEKDMIEGSDGTEIQNIVEKWFPILDEVKKE